RSSASRVILLRATSSSIRCGRNMLKITDYVKSFERHYTTLAYAVAPETFADFVDLVAPELQRRGRYKRDYAPGTLREKLYGEGRARLDDRHPAHRHRAWKRAAD